MSYALRDGVRIYWTETGSGEPLLLIMGLGATHEMWDRLLPVVAPRFRTILFDNRGVGRSDVPPPPYSIEAMAADSAAVLDAAGVEDAHVFGAAMGGMIAQEFACRYASRVRSLILGCTSCGGREAIPARRAVIDALSARETMAREEALRMMVPYIYDASTPRDRIEKDIAVRLRTSSANDGYFAQLQAIRSWSGSHSRLGTIAAPTLVIHGENDELVPAENGRVIARAIPKATLAILPRASHIFLTDQLDAAGETILAFFRHIQTEGPAQGRPLHA